MKKLIIGVIAIAMVSVSAVSADESVDYSVAYAEISQRLESLKQRVSELAYDLSEDEFYSVHFELIQINLDLETLRVQMIDYLYRMLERVSVLEDNYVVHVASNNEPLTPERDPVEFPPKNEAVLNSPMPSLFDVRSKRLVVNKKGSNHYDSFVKYRSPASKGRKGKITRVN